jgi:hypothetical protein
MLGVLTRDDVVTGVKVQGTKVESPYHFEVCHLSMMNEHCTANDGGDTTYYTSLGVPRYDMALLNWSLLLPLPHIGDKAASLVWVYFDDKALDTFGRALAHRVRQHRWTFWRRPI